MDREGDATRWPSRAGIGIAFSAYASAQLDGRGGPSGTSLGASHLIHPVDGQKKSPLIGPFKGINKEINIFFYLYNFCITFRVQKLRFLAFS